MLGLGRLFGGRKEAEKRADLKRQYKALAAAAIRSAYDGGALGHRLQGWKTSGVGPNAALLAMLTTQRQRSRDLARNNPWARQAVSTIVSNVIGTRLAPLPALRPTAIWIG